MTTIHNKVGKLTQALAGRALALHIVEDAVGILLQLCRHFLGARDTQQGAEGGFVGSSILARGLAEGGGISFDIKNVIDHLKQQAYAVGKAAVELALKGNNAVMPAIVRKADKPYRWSIGVADLNEVANVEKIVKHEVGI